MLESSNIQDVLARLKGAKPTGQNQWDAFCPSHEDPPDGHNPSLGIKCTPDGTILLNCRGGCETKDVLAAIGLSLADLFSRPPSGCVSQTNTTYEYRRADGTPYTRTVKTVPKGFYQQRYESGTWINGLNGLKPILYRLPELLAADLAQFVFITEGEKDVDRLASDRLTATTNLGGAGKWRPEYGKHLKGRRVVVLPDNDTTGRDHAQEVARCMDGVAAEVKVLNLPGLPAKGDVSDWLNNGGTPKKLLELAGQTPAWKPTAEPTEQELATYAFPLTDLGNAEWFVAQYGQDVRWCGKWNCWLVWTGKRWARDAVGQVERWMKATIREIGKQAQNEGDKKLGQWAKQSESRKRLRDGLELAKSELGIPIDPIQLDTDPWRLNCENGVIDLHNGKLGLHCREEFMTKMCPVKYEPGAKYNEWDSFLDDAVSGDKNKLAFIQRALGYSCTGLTTEEVLFLISGLAGTGKSTLMEAIKATLGDYALTADFETFLKRSQVGGTRNDIARLEGARLVSSIEVDEGKHLAEGLVKAITGGDTITARRLYQEATEFVPQLKLWLCVNDCPEVNSDDTGMWRRILRIVLDHVVPREARDRGLKARLKDTTKAGPAVLAWLVEGCLAWQRDGLDAPETVTQATKDYRDGMDKLLGFMDECCDMDDDLRVPVGSMRWAYLGWCREHDEYKYHWSAQKFNRRLEARGYTKHSTGKLWKWWGIGLTPKGLELADREKIRPK